MMRTRRPGVPDSAWPEKSRQTGVHSAAASPKRKPGLEPERGEVDKHGMCPDTAATPTTTPAIVPEARHYRVPRRATWWGRGMALSGIVVVVLSLLSNQGGTFGLIGGLFCALAVVVVWIWSERRLPRAGIYETAEGLWVVKLVGSGFVHWQQIAGFETSSKRPRTRVMLLGVNGARVPLIGTAQGALIAWDGGETLDIVGVLNDRRVLWQAAAEH